MRARLSLIVASLSALAACDRPIPTELSDLPSPAFAIFDEARGGDTDFYWLPPTVPTMPGTNGPFDSAALDQLVVEVCALNSSSACTGSVIARLTSTSKTRIKLDAPNQSYSVSWSTGNSVSASTFYRVRVFRNGIEVGFIDVDVVSSSAELAGVDRSRYVGVVRRGTLDLRFRVEVPAPSGLRLNEIESSGGSPGDWVELYNSTSSALGVGGFVIRDNSSANTYRIPAGTTIAAGGYLVVEEATLLFGLGAPDDVRLLSPGGAPLETYTWTAHATTTYGRCPNGVGNFGTTGAPTKGAANQCGGAIGGAWPGGSSVATADAPNVLGGNISGLAYEGTGSAVEGVLWAVKNGPGRIYRQVWNGLIWVSDTSNGWSTGKTLRYPGGTGDPDAEGVAVAATSAEGIYVATERNNSVSGTSRNSILRFDPASASTTLTATHEWNLTGDLPVVGSNTGLEAITWVPDAFLVSRGFFDESKGSLYDPADYPTHGSGLLFVGLEANGRIYAYALNHSAGTFTRVATIVTGFVGVMGLEFDRELSQLWATCDDGCAGRSAVLLVDTRADSPTLGRFLVAGTFDRPSGLANLNNEGFAVAPQAQCIGGVKPVFWSDDSATSGYALRRGTLTCLAFTAFQD